ncbi:MAG: hypothetical protein HND58_10915 [Planctomycetota bacterium]|nr:MAG: hypothetical protein HND58_10915 [Planctomycetota bacterium]
MNIMERAIAIALAALLPLTLAACDGGSPKTSGEAEHGEGDGHDHSSEVEAEATGSDRVAIPAAVRSNLGISFVKVERRRVEQTLRVPGRFEYLPTARREYRTAVPGRVELVVEQFDRVEAGQPLYRLDSPSWREMQQQLADAEAQIERLDARLNTFEPLLAAHQQHEDSLHESVTVWNERVEQL